MNESNNLAVGVDVSKEKLDISYAQNKVVTYSNSSSGIRRLFRKISKINPDYSICCEATGSYSERLIKECLMSDIPVSLINPLHIKHYIRSYGRIAKTDKIDAQFIRRFAEDRTPKTLDKGWLGRFKIKQLKRRKRSLVKQCARLKADLDKYDDGMIKREIRSEINRFTKKIQTYRDKIDQAIQEDEELENKRQLLQSVPGIGKEISAVLVVEMPELGMANRREIASLAGLAPQHRESGKMDGKRTTQAGRKEVKSSLYMAAVVAISHNPPMKTFYERLKSKGKPSKVALLAVARKLLTYLNSLLKKETVRI